MNRCIAFLRKHCPLSVRDFILSVFSVTVASVLCVVLHQLTSSDTHVPLIFVLMVLIVALTTNGYFYGILAALVSVFAVNWAFTYPYMKLDFSVYGYPLTFITMLAVSIASSMLASGLKERDKYIRETEAEKTRSVLLRSISHDLRTPLTVIDGSISAVLDSQDPSSSSCRELLVNAREESQWLYRMVENLLSVTQLEGEQKIIKTPELIEEIIGEAAYSFEKKYPRIELNVRCPDRPLFVPMDALLIKQVLMNLLENAVQHGKTVDMISISAEDLPGSVRIAVHDNGQGIDPKLIPELFSGKLSSEFPDPAKGNRFMGIGLSVCNAIITAHGGLIGAENHPGSGAVFFFTLPKGDSGEHTRKDSCD